MKIIKQGKYELHYDRYIDDMGFERDSFSLFDRENRIHRPFFAPFKVSNATKNSAINRLHYKYTNKELKEILKEQIRLFFKKKLNY